MMGMKLTKHQTICCALLYASLFDYPLRLEEIKDWCLASNGKTQDITKKDLVSFYSYEGYYSTKGNIQHLVNRRKNAELVSSQKFKIAQTAVHALRCIPTILLVGISGGVAAGNAQEEDDVDIFIITAPKTIWITRLFVLFVLELLGKRRRAHTIQEKDLLCPNMFLDESSCSITHHSLYLAHEILHCQPIFERGDTYRQFLKSNEWVTEYFPYLWKKRYLGKRTWLQSKHTNCIPLLSIFEPVASFIERQIMASKRTTEVVTNSTLQFHPKDTQAFVKKELSRLLKQFHVPLDSRFF
jgi:hypothetical protein